MTLALPYPHAKATALAAATPCLLCTKANASSPCHFPKARGSFMADPWHPSKWVPLCPDCHRFIDAVAGIGTSTKYAVWQIVRTLLQAKAEAEWWPQFRSSGVQSEP